MLTPFHRLWRAIDSTVGLEWRQRQLEYCLPTGRLLGCHPPGAHVTINSGTVTLNADETVASITLNGGTLQGSFNMTVTGNMSLNGWHLFQHR
jgi:hypothetical protein